MTFSVSWIGLGTLLTIRAHYSRPQIPSAEKAWVDKLQTKVNGLTADNDRLKNIVQNLTNEVARRSAILDSHRDCQGMSSLLAQVDLKTIPGQLPPGTLLQYRHGQSTA